jgi:hypothetical protein
MLTKVGYFLPSRIGLDRNLNRSEHQTNRHLSKFFSQMLAGSKMGTLAGNSRVSTSTIWSNQSLFTGEEKLRML